MQPASAHVDIRDLPDAEIARHIVAGDRTVFTALMRRHNQTLYRTARSILKDGAEAEDAVQEAYLLAYRAMSGFRAEAKLSTWLVRIVVNESIGRKRKQDRRAEVIWLSGDSDLESEPSEFESMNDSSHEQPERAASRAQTRRLIEASIRPAAGQLSRGLRAARRGGIFRGRGGARAGHSAGDGAHALLPRGQHPGRRGDALGDPAQRAG